MPVFLSLSLSLLLPLLILLPLIVDCASLSLELSADIRDDAVSCCKDNGRVLPTVSNRVDPQPIYIQNYSLFKIDISLIFNESSCHMQMNKNS